MQKRKLEIKTKEVKPEIQSDSFIGVGPCMDNISWSNYWTISPNGFPDASQSNTNQGLISCIAAHPGNYTVAADAMTGFAVGYVGSLGNVEVGAAVGAIAASASCMKCTHE